MSKWWPNVLAPLNFWTFDPNGPIWHVYKICALFTEICVQVATVHFVGYFWRSSIWNIAPEQIFRGSSQITFQTHCLNANATIWKLNLLYNFSYVRTFLMFDLLSKGTLWRQHKKSERQISGMFLDIQNTPHSFEGGGVTHESGSKRTHTTGKVW